MDTSGLSLGSRRNEDIALDLMKFIAMTTSYGKTTGRRSRLSGHRSGRQARGLRSPAAGALRPLLEVGGRQVKRLSH